VILGRIAEEKAKKREDAIFDFLLTLWFRRGGF